jgi:hypothetical protein
LLGHLIEAGAATGGIFPQTVPLWIAAAVGCTRKDLAWDTFFFGNRSSGSKACEIPFKLGSSQSINRQVQRSIRCLVQELVPLHHGLPRCARKVRFHTARDAARLDERALFAATVVIASTGFGVEVQYGTHLDVQEHHETNSGLVHALGDPNEVVVVENAVDYLRRRVSGDFGWSNRFRAQHLQVIVIQDPRFAGQVAPKVVIRWFCTAGERLRMAAYGT